jgi:hypothetical protein
MGSLIANAGRSIHHLRVSPANPEPMSLALSRKEMGCSNGDPRTAPLIELPSVEGLDLQPRAVVELVKERE